MRKAKRRRRTKRVIGYGFISENIMNLLGRPAIKIAGKAMAKAAASALGKAAAKAAGSKIGNMVANKILPSSSAGEALGVRSTPHAAELPPAPPRDELIAELNETPSREQIFKSVNLLSPAKVYEVHRMNDDYN